MMKKIAGALTAYFLFTLSAGAFAGNKVTIAGDPCSVPLITKLAEGFSARNKDFKAEVSTFSCTLGVDKAAKGEFDIGVSTQNGLDLDLLKGATNSVITKSPIVMIVNKANPVTDLTYDQLKGILSGKIKNWKEVGGREGEIKNVMLEPCVRRTISKQAIGYGELIQLTPNGKVNPVTYTNSLVEGDEGALGQQIYGYESENIRVLKIDGLLPDENTLPGKYRFYQDFNLVTKADPKGAVKEFIEFAFSQEGKEIIKSLKHLP